MILIEEDHVKKQLLIALQTKQQLDAIAPKEIASKNAVVRLGSLVETNYGLFYISVGERKSGF